MKRLSCIIPFVCPDSGLEVLNCNVMLTGKSFSEVLIYLSINPQYDNKLFNDLQVQYKKIPRAEHDKNMSRTCYVFTQIVLNV